MVHPTPQDWEANKSVIYQLYMVENLPLPQVIDLMCARRFRSTKRVYKKYFDRWGWRKYKPRKKRELDVIRHPGPSSTDPPRPYPPLSVPACIFVLVRNYSETACRQGLWFTPEVGRFTTDKNRTDADAIIEKFVGYWLAGLSPANPHSYVETGQQLNRACELIPSLVHAEHPLTIRAALELLRWYKMAGFYNFACLVIRHIHEIAAQSLGASHPLAQMFKLLLRQDQETLDEVVLRVLECGLHALSREIGDCSFRFVPSRISPLRCFPITGPDLTLEGDGTIVTRQLVVDDDASKMCSSFDEMLLDHVHKHPGSDEEELEVDFRKFAKYARGQPSRMRRLVVASMWMSLQKGVSEAVSPVEVVENLGE